jgi:hypothetical protein
MRIIYNTPKKSRYKKGTIKVKSRKKRMKIFDSIECKGYWWNSTISKWIKYEDWQGKGDIGNSYSGVRNVKQLVRYMKKSSKYLPKGTKFILRSRFRSIKDIIGLL